MLKRFKLEFVSESGRYFENDECKSGFRVFSRLEVLALRLDGVDELTEALGSHLHSLTGNRDGCPIIQSLAVVEGGLWLHSAARLHSDKVVMQHVDEV